MERAVQIDKYEVHLFLNDIDTPNIVIELAFENHGANVLEQYNAFGNEPFHYVVITGLDWENDLSPWAESGLLSKSDSFGGRVDIFLDVLEKDIVPKVLKELDVAEPRLYLIGYSLAGLCVLYNGYRSNVFVGVGSISGALWYPKFFEFVRDHTLQNSVKAVYLSLGDKEYKTRNLYMSQVQERTESIQRLLDTQGLQTVFELNPGNHFKDETLRIAKGIQWLLSYKQ